MNDNILLYSGLTERENILEPIGLGVLQFPDNTFNDTVFNINCELNNIKYTCNIINQKITDNIITILFKINESSNQLQIWDSGFITINDKKIAVQIKQYDNKILFNEEVRQLKDISTSDYIPTASQIENYVESQIVKFLTIQDNIKPTVDTLEETINNIKIKLTDYVQNNKLDEVLTNYVKNNKLGKVLTDYVSNDKLDEVLTDYIQNDKLTKSLADYVQNNKLDESLIDYVQNNKLDKVLTNYVQNDKLDKVLTNYVQTHELQNYPTKTDLANILLKYIQSKNVTNKLNNYVLTKTLNNKLNNYVLIQDLESSLVSINKTLEAIITNIHNIKTNFVTKEYVDTQIETLKNNI